MLFYGSFGLKPELLLWAAQDRNLRPGLAEF
jgi:hypothetical protein